MTKQIFRESFNRLDETLIQFMTNYGVRLMRGSLAIVFIWFGMLKVVGRSPVYDLVSHTVYWVPPEFFVPFLGVWETLIGLGLLFGVALRFTLFLFWILMAGTFSVLIFHPEIAFQGRNPLLLTVEGEFVIKNLVLLTCGLVIGSTVRRKNN